MDISRHTSVFLLAAILAAVPALTAIADKPADLVLLGGKVVTMDDDKPAAEAVAVRGDRIAAVGTDEEIRRLVGEGTRVIDVQGKLVIPGFVEGHGHFVGLGRAKMTLDLGGAQTWQEVVARVAEAAKKTPKGRWIVGRGWHQSKWKSPPEPNVEGYPTHDALSRAVPDHPVLLTHASGHMCLANAKAMQLAGVDRDTPDPPGGAILRDASGDAIGAFRESAAGLIHAAHDRAQDDLSPDERRRHLDEAIRLATDDCLSKGITTFHDAGSSFGVIDRFRRLAREGKLRIRLWVMINEQDAALERRLADYRIIGLGDHHLTVRAIKRFADGALGTQGAWLLEPYADLPESTGHCVTPPEALRRTAELAIEHGFQLCTHAIGDRANREVLGVYAETFREHPEKTDLRWRIEHAQHLDPDDIPRFKRLGVIAAMQGVHCTSDAPFVIERLGEKRAREGAYAWRSLLETGAVIVNGTDAPVEDVDPIACFYASVTRKPPGRASFFPEQRMTRRQALHSYTTAPAFAAFEENVKGTITPGKLADIVVLSRDILTVPDDQIPDTHVDLTILGGKPLYRRTRAATEQAANLPKKLPNNP